MPQKDSEAVGRSIEENRQYHLRYLRAVNNPLRRMILRTLDEKFLTVEDLRSRTGLDAATLHWHLNILEHGSCVEKTVKRGKLVYRLTQEGRVVEYLDQTC